MTTDFILFVSEWIIYAITCQAIDVFGVVTNIINIICFVKQGFKDTVNISLLGLAVSDLGCLSTLILANICHTPAFAVASLPFDAIDFHYLTSAIPHTAFTRVTACLTAVITLERCLCITAPLKVKNMVTQKRLIFIVISIFIVLLSSMAPVYVVNKLDMKYYPKRNITLLGLVFREDRDFVEGLSFAINNAFIPFTAFIIITICTITLEMKLKSSTKWRQSKTRSGTDNVTIRNQKVAKMVVIISALFISCFTPVSVIIIAMILQPDLSLDGPYRHILITLGGIAICLESINSASNIFIYYNMSSSFRYAFNQLFSKSTNKY